MKQKVLQFLKTKLPGVQESYLEGVADNVSKTITEEAQIETVLSAGVIEAIKFSADHLQREGDRRATDAQKKAVEAYREKHGLDENGKPIQKEPQKPDPNEPEWFKKYREQNDREKQELSQKLEGYEKSKVKSELTAKVRAKLTDPKGLNIPESFLSGRNLDVDSEEHIDRVVEQVGKDYTAFHQDLVNRKVVVDIPPSGGGAGDKVSIDTYLDEKFPKNEPKK